MKKTFLLIICFCFVSLTKAQVSAITETGEEVILYETGKWEYKKDKKVEKKEIPTNSKEFKRSKSSTFLLKSKKLNVGFWLNPQKWFFEKSKVNKEAEYQLTLKQEDLHAIIIAEPIEIPLLTLKDIALENAKNAASDIKITEEEYRIVNGKKVLFISMTGTMRGIKFSYYGYFYSDEEGTVQFVTYTSQNLLNKYKKECAELLNGLVKLD